MRISLSIGRSQKCETCNSHIGHKKNCPVPAIAGLEKARRYNLCPICHADGVDFNDLGLFECRYCHLQFKKADNGDIQARLTNMSDDLDLDAGIFKVVILENRGAGNFPIDQEIVRLEKIAKAMRENGRNGSR